MSIYLGDSGHIELQRTSTSTELTGDLEPSDVSVTGKRFSFDFEPGSLLTGDQVDIETLDGSLLELVAGHPYDTWRGYVAVDDLGGIRLYTLFEDALAGDFDQALALTTPSVTKRIRIATRSSIFRGLARLVSYELTTSRETVDITELGEQMRRNYANGLISGQGTLSCFWEYKAGCEDDEGNEYPRYLAQLVLRTQQGASFLGRFYLNTDVPRNFVWYEAQCIVTNVAMAFEASQLVRSQIQFVTTGPIRLLFGQPPGFLLQENADKILQEDGSGIALEQR